MFEVIFHSCGLILSLVMLLRLALMVTGKFKDPMLAQFERYGGNELKFSLFPDLLLWGALALIFGHLALKPVILLPHGMMVLGGLLLYFRLIYPLMGQSIREDLEALSPRPLWYRRLLEYTAREERRQLAYMWLRLPRRTRLIFNVNDRAFYQWADLIVVSTTF